MKKLLSILLAVVALAGCGKEEEGITGTYWQNTRIDNEYEIFESMFFRKKTVDFVYIEKLEGKEIRKHNSSGNYIYLHPDITIMTDVLTTVFFIDGNKMIKKGNSNIIYIQK
ncbi:hypothetical protein EZS27_033064 [termite gut metagenome]|uniref:Lipoprotein n=1 Tax=termite gut metagenome TaxID=433724 RepID=A0A5J4Q7S1_9ZZZZ